MTKDERIEPDFEEEAGRFMWGAMPGPHTDAHVQSLASFAREMYSRGIRSAREQVREMEGQRATVAELAALAGGVTMLLLSAMETCHICQGVLCVSDGPIHCENCAWDCSEHDAPSCAPLDALHVAAKAAILALLAAIPAAQPAPPVQFSGIDSGSPEADARDRLAMIGFAEVERRLKGLGTGIDLITAERYRQVLAEGWTPQHDDQHAHGEMAEAAICYALRHSSERMPLAWPWEPQWWKPKDRISNLVRAGALIAAEIDRLKRIPAAQEQRQEQKS